MTQTTLPPPPTDGTHPHAQPVHYAHRPEYRNASTSWQRDLKNLVRSVAASSRVSWEIDRLMPPQECTAVLWREVIGGGIVPDKIKPFTPGKSAAEEKSNRSRNRDNTPRLPDTVKIGVSTITCADCGEVVVRTGATQLRCKPCAVVENKRKQSAAKRAKIPVEIICKRCGEYAPRTKQRQNFCDLCESQRAAYHREYCKKRKRESQARRRAAAKEAQVKA